MAHHCNDFSILHNYARFPTVTPYSLVCFRQYLTIFYYFHLMVIFEREYQHVRCFRYYWFICRCRNYFSICTLRRICWRTKTSWFRRCYYLEFHYWKPILSENSVGRLCCTGTVVKKLYWKNPKPQFIIELKLSFFLF